ncbi:peptidase S41 [Hymenobacter nivis]|uniref:Peptidase S41 n=1 Tax=Hymenobacter nivis TaxID=1850093 RepID=A0A502GVX4_9BACT|nr:peptidase S41 [Hymenobacter nivis]
MGPWAAGVGWVGLAACQPQPAAQQGAPALARVVPKARVLEDLVLFQRIKEAAHAGIYKYRSKAQMDSAFAAARAQATDGMTVIDVYRLVVGITNFEGSLHNDTALPAAVRAEMHAAPAFFPYPVKLVAGQLLLNTARGPLPLGALIASINGIPARRLVRELGRYYTTDGLNTTGKTVGLAADFPEYYRLEYGPQAAFVVRYTVPGRPGTLAQTMPAVPYRAYEQAFAARHSKPFDDAFFNDAPRKYTFRLLPNRPAAVLTVNTFDIGEAGTAGHRRYAAFLDSCFGLLRQTPAITDLLVDVRANGGGDDNNDMHTFAYLAHAPFRENKGATVSFRQVPCRRYLSFEKNTAERATAVREIAGLLRTDFAGGPNGQLHQTARSNPVFQPRPNRFRGRLYLLISPRLASAGSMFAAMVRGRTAATVIGEETMGGYYGHTGHGELAYTLPNTGIQTSFYWVDLQQDVPPRAGQPFGRGVLPDYPVAQSRADFLANRDPQLAFALKLMAARAAGAAPTRGPRIGAPKH